MDQTLKKTLLRKAHHAKEARDVKPWKLYCMKCEFDLGACLVNPERGELCKKEKKKKEEEQEGTRKKIKEKRTRTRRIMKEEKKRNEKDNITLKRLDVKPWKLYEFDLGACLVNPRNEEGKRKGKRKEQERKKHKR